MSGRNEAPADGNKRRKRRKTSNRAKRTAKSLRLVIPVQAELSLRVPARVWKSRALPACHDDRAAECCALRRVHQTSWSLLYAFRALKKAVIRYYYVLFRSLDSVINAAKHQKVVYASKILLENDANSHHQCSNTFASTAKLSLFLVIVLLLLVCWLFCNNSYFIISSDFLVLHGSKFDNYLCGWVEV